MTAAARQSAVQIQLHDDVMSSSASLVYHMGLKFLFCRKVQTCRWTSSWRAGEGTYRPQRGAHLHITKRILPALNDSVESFYFLPRHASGVVGMLPASAGGFTEPRRSAWASRMYVSATPARPT